MRIPHNESMAVQFGATKLRVVYPITLRYGSWMKKIVLPKITIDNSYFLSLINFLTSTGLFRGITFQPLKLQIVWPSVGNLIVTVVEYLASSTFRPRSLYVPTKIIFQTNEDQHQKIFKDYNISPISNACLFLICLEGFPPKVSWLLRAVGQRKDHEESHPSPGFECLVLNRYTHQKNCLNGMFQ